MAQEYFEIVFRLLVALLAGGLIGLERSHRGRPAGFRTHALVCLASCLLMLVTVYESHWLRQMEDARLVLDPTRMAQGIMTGIGFVGAGAIIKEGFTVRGLTTAASIWMAAAIGILAGIGFYFATAAGTILTLAALALLGRVEARVPTDRYARFVVRFPRDQAMPEAELRALVAANGFTSYNLGYRMLAETGQFEYQMMLRTRDAANLGRLAQDLRAWATVEEFRVIPASE